MILFSWLINLWNKYQENKKWRDFYSRLDRNAEGRFTKKKYMKDLNKTLKSERDKKRIRQEDAKK